MNVTKIKLNGVTYDLNDGGAVKSVTVNGQTYTPSNGNVTLPNGAKVYANTTAYWTEHTEIVSEAESIYIYTDYDTSGTDVIPAIKIGDGSAYVVDLPFIAGSGITSSDISNWNNKVAVRMSTLNLEEVIFYN